MGKLIDDQLALVQASLNLRARRSVSQENRRRAMLLIETRFEGVDIGIESRESRGRRLRENPGWYRCQK